MKGQSLRVIFVAIALSTIALLLVIVAVEWSRPRESTIILPAGENYLGAPTQ